MCPEDKGWYINKKNGNCCSKEDSENEGYSDWKNKMGQYEKWYYNKCTGEKKKVSTTAEKVVDPLNKYDKDIDKDPETDDDFAKDSDEYDEDDEDDDFDGYDD